MKLEPGRRKRLNTASEFIFNEDGTRDEFVLIFDSEDIRNANIIDSIPNMTYIKILYHRLNAKSVQIEYNNCLIGWVYTDSFNSNKDTSKVHSDWLDRKSQAKFPIH